MGTPAEIGVRIRKRRLELGLKPEHLALKCGASRASIFRWERGDSPPDRHVFILADALGVSSDWLLSGGEDTRKKLDEASQARASLAKKSFQRALRSIFELNELFKQNVPSPSKRLEFENLIEEITLDLSTFILANSAAARMNFESHGALLPEAPGVIEGGILKALDDLIEKKIPPPK